MLLVTRPLHEVSMYAAALPFPAAIPQGFEPLDDEPRYDPARHLALETPDHVLTLADLGYDRATIASCASPISITAPFRVLSEEGVAAARAVALALRRFRLRQAGIAKNRVTETVFGATYHSRFVRDLCACPRLAAFMSEIAGTPLQTHSVPGLQLGLNFAPEDVTKAVDTWHVDSLGFDCVTMLSDPSSFEGGAFQYFLGTKEEGAGLLGTTPAGLPAGFSQNLPDDRVRTVPFPGAGYGFFMQGNMILHRATRLMQPAERIAFIPCFVSRDVGVPDPTNTTNMRVWNHRTMVEELARHAAWRSRAKLDAFIDAFPYDGDRPALAAALRGAIVEIQRAIDDIETLPQAQLS